MKSKQDNRIMDGTKLPYHKERIEAHFDRNEIVAPIHIDWGIAKFCNVACVFCFGQYQNMMKKYIQREPLMNALRDAGKEGVKSVAFIGDGEPTVNPNWKEAMYVAKESGLDVAISTNGVLVNNDEARHAILDNATWMRFCLAAGDREGYKRIHQRDYFDKVKKNVADLVNMRDRDGFDVDIGLQSVYVPGAMDEDMIKESELAVKLGVDYFVIKQCSLPDKNKKVGQVEFNIEAYEDPKTKETLEKCESYSNDRTQIIPKWATMKRKGAREYKHCPAVPLISEISGNGDWFPCGYFFGEKPEYDNLRFGNLHEQSFSEILHSDRYWKIIDHMRNKFNSSTECTGSCRLDPCNKEIDKYLKNKELTPITIKNPKGVNFI